MPDLSWNREVWNSRDNWPDLGEGWSAPWGSSESQWFGTLLPRLRRLLPARRILEIAPGYGRWTKFLIPACSEYLGIDISEGCVTACADRFRHADHARFVQNDGLSLGEAEDFAFDLVFSFDSLVHAEIDVFQSYIPQIIRKLTADGVAFLHHSNLNGFDNPEGVWSHARAGSVSGRIVGDLVKENGGRVLIQEIITWISSGPIDCLTTFGLEGKDAPDPIRLVNVRFTEEASLVAQYQNPYGKLR